MRQSEKLSITFLLTFLLYLGVSLFLSLQPWSSGIPLYADLVLSQALLILPALCYVRMNRVNLKRVLPRRRLTVGTVLCLIGMIFALEPLLTFVNYASSLLFGSGTAGLNSELIRLPAVGNILFVAVMPAFTEETVFRGVYYQGLRRNGFWKAALVSGLFFGLMHANWNQFSYGFLLGVLFALLIEATGSIYAPMLVHFGINFQSVMALNSYRELGEQEYESLMENGSRLLYGSDGAVSSLMVSYLFLAAAVSLGLCILLLWGITKLSERTGYMNWVLRGGEQRHLEETGKERLLSVPLVLAVFVPSVIICVLQVV